MGFSLLILNYLVQLYFEFLPLKIFSDKMFEVIFRIFNGTIKKGDTVKFVNTKKIKAPKSDPEILEIIVDIKNFETKPIIITLPQVNNVSEWKPINKSVIKKLIIKAGKNFIPKTAGT